MKNKNLKISIIFVLAVFLFNAGYPVYSVESGNFDSADLARNLVNDGKVGEAEQLLLAELKNNPKSVAVCIELAELYINSDQLSKARNIINKAFKIAPNNSKLFSLTSELLFRNSQYDEAAKVAQKALLINPDDSSAYLVLARINLLKIEKNKYLPQSKVDSLRKESLRNFKQASRNNPASAEAHIGLAKVYLADNQLSKAYDELLIAEELGFYNPAIAYFIGESYYKLGKYEKALKFLKRPEVYNSAKYYYAHFIIADINEKLANPDIAKKEYLAALKYKPNCIEARVRLEQLTENYEVLSKLRENSTLVKNVEAKSDGGSVTLADYYMIMDKFSQSRELYRKVLEKNPEDLRARVGICELYYSQWLLGQFNSRSYFEDNRYLNNDLNSPDLVIPALKVKITNGQGISANIKEELNDVSANTDRDVHSLLNASRAAFLLGDYKLSYKLLHTLVIPDLSDYEKFNAAKGLFFDRNYYEAKSLLQSLQKTYPDEVIASILDKIEQKIRFSDDLINDGKRLYKKKNYNGAISRYKQALREFPTYSPALLNYAYALKKIGNNDLAVEKINQYLELEKVYPSIKPEVNEKEMRKFIDSLKNE